LDAGEDAEALSLIMRSVDRFCAERLSADDVRRRDEAHQPPYDLLPAMARLGLMRAPFKAEHGGLGLSWLAFCRIQERLGYSAYFAGSILNRIVAFGAMPIVMFGTVAQRSALLPRLLDGEAMIALALSEPEAGSDARAVRTSARRTGDGWIISGRKTWISDAGEATHLLTLCRGADGDQPALTAFLVPRRSAGIAMTPIAKVGNNCMPSFDIGFDAVPVADDDRLGAVGEGFKTVSGALGYSRASMAATAVGCAKAALDLALEHAKSRVQFGKPIGEFQVIKHRLADMKFEITKAELLVAELARRIDGGEDIDIITPMAKLAATEALQFVTAHGMQILASAGYASESPMQRYWRDARLFTFGEGTSEIQREIIARHLGLR
jgi:alkylation response protein AidB-like acyl-CoA dehydrogenase